MKTSCKTQPLTRTLIVDDEQDILRFLGRSLSKQGHDVRTTDHPMEALEWMKQSHYDLLITDLKMPEMDGMALLKKVRESSPKTEVIMMTGYASVGTGVGSIKLGAFDYIMKPFNMDEFREVVRRAIQQMHASNDVNRFRDLDQMKEEFLGHVSHELRTPLTCINAASKILLDEFRKGESHLNGEVPAKMLSILNRSSNKMVDMVDDLLEMFRFETAKVALKKVTFSAERMVAEIVEEFLAPAQERGLTLRSDVERHVPAIVADPVKLRQAFLNLLGNAMKFTPNGGMITFGARISGGGEELPPGSEGVEFFVKDTGVGIAPDQQEKIFGKFFQVKESPTQGKPGLGLGLSLVRSIIEAHHGAVSVESVPGAGSTFYVRIPIRSPDSSSNRGDEKKGSGKKMEEALIGGGRRFKTGALGGNPSAAEHSDVPGHGAAYPMKRMPNVMHYLKIFRTRASEWYGAVKKKLRQTKESSFIMKSIRDLFSRKRDVEIVVVDDDADVLKTLGKMLEKKSYKVTAFGSPFSALDYLKEGSANLILTDLKMPGMDGMQFMDRVREFKPDIPVILMTSFATVDTAVTATRWGAFGYLRKPFSIEEIYKVVEKALTASENRG